MSRISSAQLRLLNPSSLFSRAEELSLVSVILSQRKLLENGTCLAAAGQCGAQRRSQASLGEGKRKRESRDVKARDGQDPRVHLTPRPGSDDTSGLPK